MIEFQGVTKDYDGQLALNHLNLTIEDGQIVGLIGHNGAGKSTTIKSLVSVSRNVMTAWSSCCICLTLLVIVMRLSSPSLMGCAKRSLSSGLFYLIQTFGF